MGDVTSTVAKCPLHYAMGEDQQKFCIAGNRLAIVRTHAEAAGSSNCKGSSRIEPTKEEETQYFKDIMAAHSRSEKTKGKQLE